MRPEILTVLLNPELQQDRGGSIAAIDTQGKLIYSTDMKKPADDTALIAAGSLTTVVDNAAVRAATKSTASPERSEFTDSDGKDAIGGFDVLDGPQLGHRGAGAGSSVLAPVSDQRRLAVLLIAVGGVLVIAASIALAWWTTRPVRRLTDTADRVTAGDLTARVEPQGSSRTGDARRGLQRDARHLRAAHRADHVGRAWM